MIESLPRRVALTAGLAVVSAVAAWSVDGLDPAGRRRARGSPAGPIGLALATDGDLRCG
jgi:hypothetical protein